MTNRVSRESAMKYLSMCSYMILFFAVLSILTPVIRALVPSFSDMETFSLSHAVQFFVVFTCYCSIFFPLYFLLGYQKSRWFNYIALLFSAGVYVLIMKSTAELKHTEIGSLQQAISLWTGLPLLLLNIFLVVLGGVFIAVSLQISKRVFARREL